MNPIAKIQDWIYSKYRIDVPALDVAMFLIICFLAVILILSFIFKAGFEPVGNIRQAHTPPPSSQ